MKTTDPLAQLERSHRRLEEACDALTKAAAHHDMETVGDVAAFFARQGRRHEEDEEQSLFPRLEAAARKSGADENVLALLTRLRDQHRAHEALHARLEEAAAGRTSDVTDLWSQIAGLADALTHAYREHLENEETTLFPAARRLLTAGELDAMLEEMRARRA
jgi:hemerythrin-like domain-containing protein